MNTVQFRAGPHRRIWCPTWFDSTDDVDQPGCQGVGDQIACIVSELDAGQQRPLDGRDQPADAGGVIIEACDGALAVSVGGSRWCSYRYAPGDVRPVLHPIIGPHGIPMTRAWPLVDDVAGEETDLICITAPAGSCTGC